MGVGGRLDTRELMFEAWNLLETKQTQNLVALYRHGIFHCFLELEMAEASKANSFETA
jgi:hypothetical protein